MILTCKFHNYLIQSSNTCITKGVHQTVQIVWLHSNWPKLPTKLSNRIAPVSGSKPYRIALHLTLWYDVQFYIGMTILPHPALSRFAPRRFFPPCKGGGAGMGWDFSSAPQGRTRIGLDFLDPTRPILTLSCTDRG